MEESRKQHKKNEKLDKKWKKEKELKKIKKVQKKAYDLLKDEKKKEFFDQSLKKKIKIKREKALKSFKKFLKIYQDDLEDFFDIFAQLDEGNVIETAAIEDNNVKSRLEKLFKSLKITANQQGIYKKTTENMMQKYVRGMFDEVVKGKPYEESSSASESIERQQEEDQETQSKKIIATQEKHNQNAGIKRNDEFVDQKFKREEVRAALYEDVNLKQKQPQDAEMNDFLENQFGKIPEKDKKLSKYLNERVKEKPIVKPMLPNCNYLGSMPEKQMNVDEVRDFMSWYDSQYRSKTLMEIHQEKMQLEKQSKAAHHHAHKDQKGRREFNRDTDLNGGTQTNEQMIQQIRQNGLNSKFSQGNLQNSFI